MDFFSFPEIFPEFFLGKMRRESEKAGNGDGKGKERE